MSDLLSVPSSTSDINDWIRKAAVTINGLLALTYQSGDIRVWATSIEGVRPVEPEWLKCNGQEVSRLTYAALFAIVGTRFGAGDGSTTFNVPAYGSKMLRGTDVAGGTSGGSDSATIAQANLPNVNFTVTDPGHTHAASTGNFVLGADGSGSALGSLTASASGEAVSIDDIQGQAPRTASATTGITVASGGSGTALTITPAHVTVEYYIKT